MNKLVEIFSAWGISFNPNEPQSALAGKRIEICDGCEHRSDFPVKRCTVCGCALKAKIFSPVRGACPKGKWDKVDEAHFNSGPAQS
jgi:hypothetical protein